MPYFGTNGIRGKLDLFTPEFASRMASAFGEWCGKGKILIGRDARTTGEMVESACVAGLLSSGCEPVLLEVVPAPTVEFLTKSTAAAGGIVITASHNPPDWVAMKFVDKEGIALSKEKGAEVERIYERRAKRVEWNEYKKTEKYPFAVRDHLSAILKTIDAGKARKRKLSVVLDCGNGTMSGPAQLLTREFGCEAVSINSHPDGFFPGRNSEPTKDNVQDLMKTVKELGADIGIAWDGDADRVIFVDEKGGYVIGDVSFALCVKIKLKEKKGYVVTTVATSNAVADVAKEFGCKTLLTKVGAPYISEEMRRVNAAIGGEEVGGVIWPELHYGKDGLMTTAKILEAVAEKPLSQLAKEIPVYYNSKTKVPCTGEKKAKVMSRLKATAKGGAVISLDGVRVDMKDGWVIARPSGTEDYIRVFAEAKTAERAKKLMQEFEEKVLGAIKEV